jgi:hypothetical protein
MIINWQEIEESIRKEHEPYSMLKKVELVIYMPFYRVGTEEASQDWNTFRNGLIRQGIVKPIGRGLFKLQPTKGGSR